MPALNKLVSKKILPFERGLHQFLKTSHAAMLDTMEKNGAKWDVKKAGADDSDAKKAFKKVCQDAEAELTAAITSFKKSFA